MLEKKRNTPKVSVIIPTRNRADMLERAINSVLGQTWQDFEIIVISDGSTDNTENVVRGFDDSRIHLLKHEKSRGASAARNTGLRIAKGEYIAFLDDDDEWTLDKLEVQLPVIEKSPPEVGLVYAWMEYFQDGKSIRVHAPELCGNVFVEMLDKQAIGGCPTVIIKRDVIKNIGYFDENLPRGNDGDYWRRISKQYQVDFVPQVLVKANVGHVDRISTNYDTIKDCEKRLKCFAEDFHRYPYQKMVVFSDIVLANIRCRKFKKSFNCLIDIIKSNITIRQKILLIYKITRGTMSFYFHKTKSILCKISKGVHCFPGLL